MSLVLASIVEVSMNKKVLWIASVQMIGQPNERSLSVVVSDINILIILFHVTTVIWLKAFVLKKELASKPSSSLMNARTSIYFPHWIHLLESAGSQMLTYIFYHFSFVEYNSNKPKTNEDDKLWGSENSTAIWSTDIWSEWWFGFCLTGENPSKAFRYILCGRV